MIGNIEASAIMIGNSAVSAVYIGSTKIYPSVPVDYSKQYLTFKVIKGGNITIKASNANVAKTIQYSTDNGSTWTSLTTSTTAQELGGALSVGDKVLVKGTNTAYGTSSYYNTFSGTAKVNVYGNIMSLISEDSFANNKTLTANYTFNKLFYKYTNILSAENLVLPAKTLTSNCYAGMFYGCTSLTSAPVLPATTLANQCYYGMFQGCTSLTSAPVLPATTLATECYSNMFYNCTKLTTAPELPAKTLASNCYAYMFEGCTRLTTAPVLPATTLAKWCYASMFGGCTNLKNAPELPAKTLANYCYRYMFSDCTNLNYIKCLATDISATSCTSNWVSGVASTGTFVKDASMSSWTTGTSGIPSGWTVQDDGVPTDNWVLVDDIFDNPRKIKVDYSLIEDDNSSVRNDYELNSHSETYMVLYLNAITIDYFVQQYGWDQEMVTENYLNMVGVVDVSGELKEILEDGVEYTQINHTSITEMDYIQTFGAENNPYLYATE